jgi:thymidylate synthase (FAD)
MNNDPTHERTSVAHGAEVDRASGDVQAPITRPAVPEIDGILGRRFAALDQGFVRVVDYMGSDDAIVQAARVSYGIGTKRVHEDLALIRYLMRHGHTTPFEMCEIKLHIRVPMDTWRQWIRHRTASVNEYSTRYSVAIDSVQKTGPEEWRMQAASNQQGSGDAIESRLGETLTRREGELQEFARTVYNERLDVGVAREQARKDLPLSTYTEAYWKTDLHNLFHFLRLRLDPHAQREIRQYAEVIGREIVQRWCPSAWEAFVDYQLDSGYFSKQELAVLRALARNDNRAAAAVALAAGWLSKGADGSLRRHRERLEAETKLLALGYTIPWYPNPDG